MLLESDEVSVYECHENSLIFDKYERNDVWPEDGDFTNLRDQHEILKSIKEDLFVLLDKCQGDVQAFLKECNDESGQEDEQIAQNQGMKFEYLKKAKQVKKNQADSQIIEE